ncbi:hypothetical protein Misp01_40710 [Microtetraspora sp. NBRC 13810]|nr:hypothetical protein Misp01_40710 [Microtetraspora sp. NBRC 13810]
MENPRTENPRTESPQVEGPAGEGLAVEGLAGGGPRWWRASGRRAHRGETTDRRYPSGGAVTSDSAAVRVW